MPFDQALEQAVASEPRKVEQSTSTWTCRELAAYLAQQGHAKVSDETVRRHLHALSYGVIRPVLSISSPDERYAEKLEKLRAHQAAAKRGEDVLLFEDEAVNPLTSAVTHLIRERKNSESFCALVEAIVATY